MEIEPRVRPQIAGRAAFGSLALLAARPLCRSAGITDDARLARTLGGAIFIGDLVLIGSAAAARSRDGLRKAAAANAGTDLVGAAVLAALAVRRNRSQRAIALAASLSLVGGGLAWLNTIRRPDGAGPAKPPAHQFRGLRHGPVGQRVIVKAVVFDWGGTLTPFANVDLLDLWQACAAHLAPDRADELCSRLLEVERRAWSRTESDQRSFRLAEILVEATASLGVDVTDAALEVAATTYLDGWTPHIVHDPDAAIVLAALRERGLQIGLLSNTHWPRAFHEHFLERDGLADLIDVRCYSCEIARVKPHPDAFGAVLQALGVPASEAVFVGDRPHDDIFGAKSVGMRAVLRPNDSVPGGDVKPDGVIGSLPGLLQLIDTWDRRPPRERIADIRRRLDRR